MTNVKAYEKSNAFRFDVEIVDKPLKSYKFGKNAPEGRTQEEYLQSCKREAILLAEHETAEKNDQFLEIVI